MSAELFHGLDKGAARLAELDHTGLQVIQGTFDETICFFVVCQEVMPERVLKKSQIRKNGKVQSTHFAQHLWISEDNHTILGSRQSHIQTPRVVQETNALMLITPDTAENDVILLSSLESIDTGNFDLFVQILLQRPVKLHVVDDI